MTFSVVSGRWNKRVAILDCTILIDIACLQHPATPRPHVFAKEVAEIAVCKLQDTKNLLDLHVAEAAKELEN
jgi:hypothetical protein